MHNNVLTTRQQTQVKWAIDLNLNNMSKNKKPDLVYAYKCSECDVFGKGNLQDTIKFISIDHAGHTTMIGSK